MCVTTDTRGDNSGYYSVADNTSTICVVRPYSQMFIILVFDQVVEQVRVFLVLLLLHICLLFAQRTRIIPVHWMLNYVSQHSLQTLIYKEKNDLLGVDDIVLYRGLSQLTGVKTCNDVRVFSNCI